MARRQYVRAIQDFDRAIMLNPRLAEAFNNRGNAYQAQGKPDRAIQDFDQAAKLNPNLAEAFFNRGITRRIKGDRAGSVADISKARGLDPNIGGTNTNAGSFSITSAKTGCVVTNIIVGC
jgi:tetratricopeptide (TPR) repeat protein